jgi:hypothetical protein
MAIAGLLIASFASAQTSNLLKVRVTPVKSPGGTGSINVLATLARVLSFRLVSPQTR